MTVHRKMLHGALVAYSCSFFPVFAEDPGTNELSAAYPPPLLEFDDSLTSTEWTTRFGHELLKNQNIFFDRMGPISGYQFVREAQTLKYGIYDQIGAEARGAVTRVIENSAQETALALLPVDEWMEILPLDKWQSFGSHLLQGSLGNTAEKEVGDVSATYSTTEASWREAGQNGTLRYGIRPSTAPYLYAASNIGHVDNRPALSLETRARYIPFNRIETSFTAVIALPDSFDLSLSALCEPMRVSGTLSAAARIQRVVGHGPLACAVFVGALHNAGESAILFGFSKPW